MYDATYITRVTVTTESGAVYLLRSIGERCYFTRQGAVPMYGEAPVNAVASGPVHLVKGECMTTTFGDRGPLRTTRVVDIEYTLEAYSRI
jgi:hypothetical protein